MHVEFAVDDVLQSLPDAPGQVNCGRRDHQPLVGLLDIDDAVERVLAFLRCLLVPCQADDLILALSGDVPLQGHDAIREAGVNAAASEAEILVRSGGSQPPLPSAVVVDGTALPTTRRFPQFLPRLIGVGNVIALGAAGDTAPSSSRVGRLPDPLHFTPDPIRAAECTRRPLMRAGDLAVIGRRRFDLNQRGARSGSPQPSSTIARTASRRRAASARVAP